MKTPLALMTSSGLLVLLASCTTPTQTLDPLELHQEILTLDAHVDFPLSALDSQNLATETSLAFDLPKMEAGEIDGAFFVLYTPQAETDAAGYAAAQEVAQTRLQIIQRLTAGHPERIARAVCRHDVDDIAASGRKVALIGMENAYPLGDAIDQVAYWAGQGVRYLGLTHWGHNQFGDSSNPNFQYDRGPRHGGLSPSGRDLVRALNDHGILIDVSHAAYETSMQAFELSSAPVIASHSGAKAVTATARNLADDQLLALAQTGGVVNMLSYAANVKSLTPAQEQFRAQLRRDMGIPDSPEYTMPLETEIEYNQRLLGMYEIEPIAGVSDYVDHIDYMVDLIGIDHVGISSDFDYVDDTGRISGWYDATQSAAITDELLARGYAPDGIAKLWGGNMLRALAEAEAVARSGPCAPS